MGEGGDELRFIKRWTQVMIEAWVDPGGWGQGHEEEEKERRTEGGENKLL